MKKSQYDKVKKYRKNRIGLITIKNIVLLTIIIATFISVGYSYWNTTLHISGTVSISQETVGNDIWVYDHSEQKVTNEYKNLTINIGDYINYNVPTASSYTGNWRVLGVEDGKLLIVSASNVTSLTLNGADGFMNGPATLDSTCSIQCDNNKAENARSINIDDVNKITGYNPNNVGVNDYQQTGTGTAYGSGIQKYGLSVEFTRTSTGISATYDGGNDSTTRSTDFKTVETQTNINENEPYTIQNDNYCYIATSLSTSSSGSAGLASSSAAYNMLFYQMSTSSNNYWLASQFKGAYPSSTSSFYLHARWGMKYVGQYSSNPGITNYGLWNSKQGAYSTSKGVRAVVRLKSDITPSLVSTSNGVSTYDI